jgi:6-phosphogluconolactonase
VEVLEPGQLCARAADAVVDVLGRAVEARGGARWVLAGGSTPAGLYREIARSHRGSLDWSRVDFYWGDERMVSPDHEESNYRRALATLLAPMAIERRRTHRIRGELGAEKAARHYDLVASEVLTSGSWDLVLLGLGADGHTASLFPSLGAAAGTRAWAQPAVAPSPPHARVSLSLRALNRSRHVFFLATGPEKAEAVDRALGGDRALPAAHVTCLGGEVRWYLDPAAGAVFAAR